MTAVHYDAANFRAFDPVRGVPLNVPLPPGHASKLGVRFFDAFVDAQPWDEDTKYWFVYLCACVLVPLSMCPLTGALFVWGKSNIAKSSTIICLLKAYPFHRLFVIPPTIRPDFAFSSCINDLGEMMKDCITCLEVETDFSVPVNQLNSIISAEHVTSDVKFGNTRTVERWNAPSVWVGNNVPEYPLSKFLPYLRRHIVVEATKKPVGMKPSVEEVDESFGPFLFKLSAAFHEKVSELKRMREAGNPLGSEMDIWRHLPDYFHRIHRRVLAGRDLSLAIVLDPMWLEQWARRPTSCRLTHSASAPNLIATLPARASVPCPRTSPCATRCPRPAPTNSS